jgi:ArsR family transcriptional regulator
MLGLSYIDRHRWFATSIDECQYLNMRKILPSLGCCLPFLQGRLEKDDAEQLAEAFKAIADPARLRLLSYIAAQPSSETCVCYLTEPLGLSQPTVSHHLKVLYEAGLLAREKRGTWAWYRIVPERMNELRNALAPPVEAVAPTTASKKSDVARKASGRAAAPSKPARERRAPQR